MNGIKRGKYKNRSNKQRSELCKIETLYKTQRKFIKIIDNYSKMLSEAK